MNEFDVLRKAFPEQEPPTPEAAAAARRQLFHKPRRSFVRAGWLGTAVTAATALVAVVGLGGALVLGRDGQESGVPVGPATTTAPRLTSAAEVLIAVAVRQEKDERVSGKYFRVRSLQLTTGKYSRRSITESWMPMKPGVASWFGWVDLNKGSAPVVNKMSFQDVPPGYYLTGDKPLSAEQIAALPTDPIKLRAYLATTAGRDLSGVDREYAVFAAAGRLLFDMPAPPKLRGAALRVLATLPGTHIRTGAKDPLGREGTEVSITAAVSKPGSTRTTMFSSGATYIIDPSTGRLLSSTIGGPKPGSTVVLESGWTDDKPTPPSTAIR